MINAEWWAIGGAAVVAVTAGERVVTAGTRKRYQRSYRYFRIIPHVATGADPEQILKLIHNLHEHRRPKMVRMKKGKEWFRYLIHKDVEGNVALYFGFPEDRQTGVKRIFRNVFPEIELQDVSHADVPLQIHSPVEDDGQAAPKKKRDGDKRYGGHFQPARSGDDEGYAFKEYQGKEDLEDILYNLDAGTKGTETWLDILISPESNREIKKRVDRTIQKIYRRHGVGHTPMSRQDVFNAQSYVDAFYNRKGKEASKAEPKPKTKVTASELEPEEKEQLRVLQKRYTGRESAFAVGIRLFCKAKYADAIVQTAATAVRSAFRMDNELRFVQNRRAEKNVLQSAPVPFKQEVIMMTGEELANILRLPRGEHRISQFVPHLEQGQRLLEKGELSEGVSLGKMIHPATKGRPVRVSLGQLSRHFGLFGMTGAGKSSALLEILESVLKDWFDNVENTPGFTLIDPAQETVATFLNRLRHYEKKGVEVDWNRVHYISFSDHNYVLPLNLLYRKKHESIHDLSDQVFELIKSTYGDLPTPQADRILRNALLTLLSDEHQQHNILGIIPLLMDERFRNRVLPHVRDPITLSFWQQEFSQFEKNLQNAVGPLLNRLSPFQTNENMRRMFGQADMGMKIRKWMDEGHIILMDFRGASNQTITLAGGYIDLQYHKEAQTRRTGSRLHLLILDEAHKMQQPVLEKVIAEDRKFGLSLGISTQSVGQLKPYLKTALTDIVNNIFTTTLGADSAQVVSRITSGAFVANYLQKLPERTLAVYTKQKVDGRNQPVTAVTECDPPYVYKPDGSGEWADHENDREMEEAFEWGLEKGRELMARDCFRASDVDEAIRAYMTTGTVLQVSRQRQEKEAAPTPPKIKRPQLDGADSTSNLPWDM